MKKVGDLLKGKESGVWSVSADATVFDALTKMSEKNIGAVLVMNGGELLGIFSERDYARKQLKGLSRKRTRVSRVMSNKVICVSPNQSIEECMELMTSKRIRHLPVLEDDRIIGVISIGDVVKYIISEQNSIIQKLEKSISLRKRKERALRGSEAEIRAILDAAVDGIVTIDSEGIIRSFNPAAAEIFGYSPEEAIGRSVNMLMPEPDRSHHDQYIANYLRSGRPKIIGIGREVVGQRKDGTTFPLYIAVSEVRFGKRVRFTGIVRDLTEFKRLQHRMLQAQNLASIGEMAASIAHEIKNPLAGISGAVEVIGESLAEEDPRRKVVTEILAQVKRLDTAVRQLLSLAKPWRPQKQLCDLRKLVEGVIDSAEARNLFAGVSLNFNNSDTVTAPVDPSAFEDVLWNLLHNAADAMPHGGEIFCSFGRVQSFAKVTIRDTGTGVRQDLLPRLFRPFFTTKTRGTGLGLSICRKIMEAHGGAIAISSEAGRGTEVTLRFPLG